MKISNLLYMGALSTLALVSCTNNDDHSEWYGSEGIVFTSAIQSRVSGNVWNPNDEVGIYMMNSGSGIEAATAQNKKYLAQTNGTLTAAPGNGIYLPESGNVDFIAYYPYTTSVSGNKIAVNVSDQSNPAAIDLIYSNSTKNIEATTATTISLAFTHQLTKMTLNVTKDATVETLNGLTVNMKGISTEGEFNLADGTLTATTGTNNKEVAMYMDAQGTTATATAIMLPTASASDQTAITLTFNLSGQSFTYTIDDTSIFEKGTNVTFNANLSINNGKPVVTVGNATITDWTEKAGGDIDVSFDGETQPSGETVVLNESFATDQGAFTIEDKQLPNGEGSFVWNHGSHNGDYFMKASAYINETKYASESWLVSPAIDLSQATTATLTFDHAHNYVGTAEEELTLWATETSADNWQQLIIDKYGSNFNFTTATIDLSAYAGKTIKFAFKYISTIEAAGTWEIMNVKVVANGEGGGTVTPEPDPEPDPEPGTPETIFLETCGQTNVGSTKYKINNYTGWDNNGVLTFSDEFAGEYQNADVRATSTLDNNIWFPAYTTSTEKPSGLKISGFNVENYTNLSLEYYIATNITPANQNIIKVRTDKGDLTIESKEFTATNKYEIVNVSLPDNITYIEFVSDANNTMGFRVDNIKLTGTKNN